TVLRAPDFRIFAEITDQDHAVNTAHAASCVSLIGNLLSDRSSGEANDVYCALVEIASPTGNSRANRGRAVRFGGTVHGLVFRNVAVLYDDVSSTASPVRSIEDNDSRLKRSPLFVMPDCDAPSVK